MATKDKSLFKNKENLNTTAQKKSMIYLGNFDVKTYNIDLVHHLRNVIRI